MTAHNSSTPHRPCPNCDAQSTREMVVWKDFHIDPRWADTDPDLVLRIGKCTECSMVYVTNSDEVDMTNTKYVHHKPIRDPKPPSGPRLDYQRLQMKMLSNYVPPGAKVMDYGSGYCDFLTAAQELGYEVEGINPNLHAAEWSKRVLGIKVYPVMGVDFETTERYDLVISNQTFEHLVNPKEDLRKVAEILADDGLALIEVPNWLNIRQVYKGRNLLKDPMHYNYFSPHTLADMARRVGLKVVKKAPVVGPTAAVRMYKTVANALGVGTCSVLLSN